MPVPHRIRTEIPQESDIRTIKGRYRTNTAEAVRREESGNHRSGGVCRPHPYARKYSAASKCSTIYGISQGKKYANGIRDRHANLKYKYESRHFWCRGYYVDTVGKNKKAIEEYIRNQLVEDEMMDQMTIKEYTGPFTGSKNSKA